MTAPSLALLHELRAQIKERLSNVRLEFYRPYEKQKKFHDGGATYRERLLRAGTQQGKTLAGAAEVAFHLTGKYPDWWKGRRWDRPTFGWVGGINFKLVRDAPQKMLMGRAGSIGSGMIPGDLIAGYTMGRNIADAIDTVRVKHTSGGISSFSFKTYESGRDTWQSETLDWVWFDEECDEEIYTEGLSRTNATGGMVWMTFTPLLGMSTVVQRFLTEESPDRLDVNMTIDDALHIPPEERARIIASYPPHEREARIRGVPMLGSGRVFPIVEEDIAVDAFPVPAYFARLIGVDFGWDHPFAAVDLAYDTQADVIYVTKTYRARETSPLAHAQALRPWGSWIPVAWPRDGRRATLEGAGKPLATQFKSYGMNMLGTHAQFKDGSVSVEAGLMDMLGRMETGRFKVFRHLNDFWEEFRMYHRKDGRVVELKEDILCATRYGVMMIRESLIDPSMRSAARRPARPSDPLAAVRV